MRHPILAVLCLLSAMTACTTPRPTAPLNSAPAVTTPPKIEARLYDDEAMALAAYPDYARREGRVLILRLDGRDIARMTSTPKSACEGFETCSLWSFIGMVRIGDTLHAVVRREHGEGDGFVVFADGGHVWMSGPPVVSPDGRYLASGHLTTQVAAGRTAILDGFAWPRRSFETETGCEPKTWLSATHLKLRCNLDDDDTTAPFDTEARLENDTWKFTFLPRGAEPFMIAPLPSPATKHNITEFEAKAGLQIID